MSEVLRYFGIAKESVFGTEVAPKFFIDQASTDINPPAGAEIIKPSGLTRVKRVHGPGMYIPEGGIEFVADAPLFWYLLFIMLGSKATTDNTSTIADEATPSDSGGIISATLASLPVVPGELIIETDTPAQEAHDDGFGNIVEDSASGLSGTIDYATGVLLVTGATVSHAYTTTYDEGTFEHIIESDNDNVMPSATFALGKDLFEHTFTGTVISQMVLSVSREWAVITLDVLAQKDEKDTIRTLVNVTLPQGSPIPFHKVTMKAADYGSALADISAIVEELTLTINNNGDGEGGVTIGSRHPRKIFAGDLEVLADLVVHFDDTTILEDFWGGAAAPSADGTQEKAYQVFLDGGVLGDVTIDLFKAIMTTPPDISPSGRDRISQSFSVEALFDSVEDLSVRFTCNSVYNYS